MLPQLTTEIKKRSDVAKLVQMQTDSQLDIQNLERKLLCETNKKDILETEITQVNTQFSSVIGKNNEKEVLQMNMEISNTELSNNATTFVDSSEQKDVNH